MSWFQCMMISNWVERRWLKLASVSISPCSWAYLKQNKRKEKKRRKKGEKEKKRSTPRKKEKQRTKQNKRKKKCVFCWDNWVKSLIVLALANFWKIYRYILERSLEWRRKLAFMQWINGVFFDIMSLNYPFDLSHAWAPLQPASRPFDFCIKFGFSGGDVIY